MRAVLLICLMLLGHAAPAQAWSDFYEHERVRVEFAGVKGDIVPAYLYRPLGVDGPVPAMLVQYGMGGNKDTDYIVELGRLIASQGFVVLTIDVPGQGERRNRPVGNNPGARAVFEQYLGDYGRALDYLESLGDVDAGRIAYLGTSWGAITGIPFAARDDRVRALVSIVGGGNLVGVVPRDLDPVRHVGQLGAPRALMLINALRDEIVLRPFGNALHAAAPADARRIWLDTDHHLTGVDRPALTAEVLSFVAAALDY